MARRRGPREGANAAGPTPRAGPRRGGDRGAGDRARRLLQENRADPKDYAGELPTNQTVVPSRLARGAVDGRVLACVGHFTQQPLNDGRYCDPQPITSCLLLEY